MRELALRLDRDPFEYEEAIRSMLDESERCWSGDVSLTGSNKSRLKELWDAFREASI